MIEYEDLLELGWRADSLDPASGELDCKGVVLESLRRGGIDAHQRWFEPGNEHWFSVPMETVRPLDVIATDPQSIDSVTHVSVVIVGGPSGFALSSSKRRGVHVVPIARLRNVVGVYRVRR